MQCSKAAQPRDGFATTLRWKNEFTLWDSNQDNFCVQTLQDIHFATNLLWQFFMFVSQNSNLHSLRKKIDRKNFNFQLTETDRKVYIIARLGNGARKSSVQIDNLLVGSGGFKLEIFSKIKLNSCKIFGNFLEWIVPKGFKKSKI